MGQFLQTIQGTWQGQARFWRVLAMRCANPLLSSDDNLSRIAIKQCPEQVVAVLRMYEIFVHRFGEHAKPEPFPQAQVVGSVDFSRGLALARSLGVRINCDAEVGFFISNRFIAQKEASGGLRVGFLP